MVKHLISVALASVLSCGIANASDNASIEGKEKITRNGVNIYLEPNSPNKQKYLSGEFDKSLEAMKKAYEANKNNKAMRAPAPPVYYVAVLGVISQQGGREELKEGQTITNNDHGGDPFVVHTLVLGYGGGSYDKASFAGNQAVQLSSEGMDYTGDNIIDGWYDIWDISKPANSSGNFEFTSRSINAPGNSMSTSIQIR
ncbi:DUF4879 domain-containing protein [Campylobacter sp. US33a]|uniref:DUF4879 domain-containing protein n=1 Tax=Campylobacter sp. CCS1377 TaxID=3158229 RepID=A0AAU7E6S3_9BACT|nr:DUF4879 domain-containing protein [Campylobacter sp. US33a]MCW1360687.1 YolA family protein [Campylobacter jejuni]TEY04074.1 DUF4879 domain-containing protein [Campylobacter sp. US33a]